MHRCRFTIPIVAITALCVGVAQAGEVALRVSARETYVGQPVQVQIVVTNAQENDPPEFPPIDGATVRLLGPPSESSQVSILNGRVSQQVSRVYTFAVTPTRPGTIQVPPVSIRVDGKTQTVAGFAIVATQSETGDLLLVEAAADRKSIYVGEPLRVTLRIWLKPYRDREFDFQFSEAHMWNCIDLDGSTWGGFAEPLQQMLSHRQRPQGREVLRQDSQGNSRAYDLYEIETTLWPEHAGTLESGELGGVNVVAAYPVRLERDRSMFSFGDLRIGATRPVTASVEPEPVVVKAVPTEGQPPYYTGAVGRYAFEVNAKPTDVRVGDPITISLTLRGDNRLDLLQAPRLAEVAELAELFQVPDEELAGTVRDGTKQFTQSIRAKTDTVTEIPPIPFAYFDPQAEKYVVLRSDPIPLRVQPSERMSISQIVEGKETEPAIATRLTELSRGILANYTDMDEVLTSQAFRPGVSALAAGVLPPVAFVTCWAMRRHRERLRRDTAYARRRNARRSALRALDSAQRSADAATTVTDALAGYVADRCGLPAAGLTRPDAVQALRARRVRLDLIERADALLHDCEGIRYAGLRVGDADHLATQAKQCIRELERERF